MHHSIIIRAAVGLSALLLLIALAFGWGTLFREQRLAAREASAAQPAPYDAAAASAHYQERCTMCHGPAQETEWMPATTRDARESALAEFLAQHAKAPAAENRVIATYLAGLGDQKNQ